MSVRVISQINDIKHLFYDQSPSVKNHNGLHWVSSLLDVIIPAGGEHFVVFELSDADIELISYDVNSDVQDADIEIHEGGAYSGGTALVYENTNRSIDTALPVTASMHGVTIDTAGASILTEKIRGNATNPSKTTYARTSENSGLIMKTNEIYYFHVTNNDNAARFFDFYFRVTQHSS